MILHGRLLVAAAILAGASVLCAQVHPDVSMSALGPGLSIVTHVSNVSPRVGEQISIVYSLRAQAPPVAIDVLPQQYTGLWVETVPLGEEHMAVRERDGRTGYEPLLRQMIAYPLREGTVQLPALGVRIRTRAEGTGAAWDVEASSRPVAIEARPPAAGGGATLVGTLRGRLEAIEDEGGRAALLELEGSANIAFLDIDRLLRIRGGWAGARLVEASSRLETIDHAGIRTLTLFNRRRWRVALFPRRGEELSIGDVVIPLAGPGGAQATELRIPGLTVSPGSYAARGAAERPQPRAGRGGLWIAGIIAAAAALAFVLLRRHAPGRRPHSKSDLAV